MSVVAVQVGGVGATYYNCAKCHRISYNPEDVLYMWCGHCKMSAEDLRDLRVTTFEHLTAVVLTHRDCFSLAILTVLDCPNNPNVRLVHAWVTSSFLGEGSIEHAWCEMPATATYEDDSQAEITVAVDHTQVDERATIVAADSLYEVLAPRHVKRYTREEAVAAALRFGHDGPWPDVSPP